MCSLVSILAKLSQLPFEPKRGNITGDWRKLHNKAVSHYIYKSNKMHLESIGVFYYYILFSATYSGLSELHVNTSVFMYVFSCI